MTEATEATSSPRIPVDRAASGHLPAAGHRSVPHTADCMIEAWGPDRASCLREALRGLVEGFAEVPDEAASSLLPLCTELRGAEDQLVSLFEEVIYALDVFSVVPVGSTSQRPRVAGLPGTWRSSRLIRSGSLGPFPRRSPITGCRWSQTKGGGGAACWSTCEHDGHVHGSALGRGPAVGPGSGG